MWGISCIFIRISLEIKLSSVCVTWKRRVDQLFDQHANLQKIEIAGYRFYIHIKEKISKI